MRYFGHSVTAGVVFILVLFAVEGCQSEPDRPHMPSPQNDHSQLDTGMGTELSTAQVLLTCKLTHPCKLFSAAFAPDERLIVTGAEEGRVRIWDSGTGTLLHEFRSSASLITSLAVSQDNRRLAAMDHRGHLAGIWDLSNAESSFLGIPDAGVTQLLGRPQMTHSLAFIDGNQRLATCNHRLQLWDTQKLQPLWTRPERNLSQLLRLSPSGEMLAVVESDHKIHFVDASSGSLVRSFPPLSGTVQDVVWSLDGLKLASVDDTQSIHVWDYESGDLAGVIRPKEGKVVTLRCAQSMCSVLIASASGCSFQQYAFSGAAITPPATLPVSGIYAAVISPDGRRIAIVSDEERTTLSLFRVLSR